MTSGFSSLNTALSALRHARVGMDVASDNIANIATEGYTRRRVESASVGSSAPAGTWFRSVGVGDGVAVTGINRMSDELLNVRSRREHANQSFLDVQAAALGRVEDGIGEPGANGLSAAIDGFRTSWSALSVTPTGTGASAARQAVLQSAATVVDTARSQARHLAGEAGDQRVRAANDVTEVDALARDLARTNGSIVTARANGGNANLLLDSRDRLTARLAELTGANALVRPDGTATVTLGGATLVEGVDAARFTVASGIDAGGAADGGPLRFAVTSPDGSSEVVAAGGELGGIAQLLDVTLPDYLAGLSEVMSELADRVNAQHAEGYDASGAPGGDFFDYDPDDVLGTLSVAVGSGAEIAASSVSPGSNGDNATAVGDLTGLADGYQRLVSGFGASVDGINRHVANQQVLTGQTDIARDQLGGVNLDEEMVNLTVLQRQYEAAARVMTTVDSLLDTLINRMGVG